MEDPATPKAPSAGEGPARRWLSITATRATRERGRRTLVRLLDAAVAEFAEFGYHGASMARLSKQAGAAHGSFYMYFADKDDLLLALVADVRSELGDALRGVPRLRPGPEGRDEIRRWLREVSTIYQRHGAVLQAINDAMTQDREPELATVLLDDLASWTKVLAGRIRAAEHGDLDPHLTALTIHGMIEGANRARFTGELAVGFEELVEALTEFVHQGVFGARADLSAADG